jgi:pilus assembly protein Flp/PilA
MGLMTYQLSKRPGRYVECQSIDLGGSMFALWTKLLAWKEDKGASMVEYALLVVLIAIIAIVAISLAGQNVSKAFSTTAGSLAAAN